MPKAENSIIPILLLVSLIMGIIIVTGDGATGEYIASLCSNVNPVFIPVMIFILGAIMSFGTGTSGGTVGILFPIAIPMVVAMQLDLPLIIGAIISGGLFGDHCSPISDSTILSSMVAEIDVMDHVSTQMPYSLIAASISCIGFLILGFTV